MSTILIIILVILLFGSGGGYYARSRYGGTGLGGVPGLVVLVLVVLWLFGGLGVPMVGTSSGLPVYMPPGMTEAT
jgi:hypothetical protein